MHDYVVSTQNANASQISTSCDMTEVDLGAPADGVPECTNLRRMSSESIRSKLSASWAKTRRHSSSRRASATSRPDSRSNSLCTTPQHGHEHADSPAIVRQWPGLRDRLAFVEDRKDQVVAMMEMATKAVDAQASIPKDSSGLVTLVELVNSLESANSGVDGKTPDKKGLNNSLCPATITTKKNKASETYAQINRKPPFMFAGILASIVSSIFFSASVLFVKFTSTDDSIVANGRVVFVRGFVFLTTCTGTMLISNTSFKVPRDEWWVNAARAVCGTVGVFGSYCALNYISMGDATALIFSSPIWTSILSHMILGEPLHFIILLSLPVCLLGIVLIAHPALILDLFATAAYDAAAAAQSLSHAQHSGNSSMLIVERASSLDASLALNSTANLLTSGDARQQPAAAAAVAVIDSFEQRWPGIVISLGVSLIVSAAYIVMKHRKKTPIQTTTFYFGAFMVLSACAFLSIAGGWSGWPDTCTEWLFLLGNGLASWLGQTCLQWALVYEEAGVLSIVRTLDVAVSFVLSALFLDEEILWTSVAGASIIGAVVASIMFASWFRSSNSNSSNSNSNKTSA